LIRLIRTLLCLSVVALGYASAQETSSLSGTVSDPSGAVISGAQVVLTRISQGTAQHTATNGVGRYTFPFVTPGIYDLQITEQGFKVFTQAGVVVETAQRSVANVNLSVGGPQETVTVEDHRALINMSDGSVGATIDRTLIENVPLNGRSLQSLWTLVPGVTQVAVGSSPDPRDGTIVVNGQRAQSNQFIVDGVSANVPSGQGYSFSPNLPSLNALGGTQGIVQVDEVQEFKVLTSTYSAEYGTSPGGQFSFSTRSGGNALHGAAYDYFRNEVFDANDWFSNNLGEARGKLRQNDFGATLGGPVVLPHWYNGHNKTFFFTAFEGLKLVTPITDVIKVPDQTLRTSAAPALQSLLNYFPTPNGADLGGGVAQYTLSASQPSTVYAGAFRVDQSFGAKLQAFARYTRSPSTVSDADGRFFENDDTSITTQSLTAGLTWVQNQNFGNDLRFNWSTTNSLSGYGNAKDGLDLFSFLQRSRTNPPDSLSVITFRLKGGIFALEQGDSFTHSQQFNLVDAFSWIKGAHALKFGGNLRRLNATLSPNTYVADTGFSSVASVQAGVADFLDVASSNQPQPAFYNYGLFINDEWSMTPRLHVQLGVRWDVNPVPATVGGQSPTVFTVDSTFSTVTAQPAGTPIYKTQYKNFAPRVGLAYSLPWGGGKTTVLRVGGGLFYDTSDALGAQPYSGFPFGGSTELDNVSFPFTQAQTAPPPDTVSLDGADGNIYAVNPKLRLPVTYAWSAAVEQSLGPRSSFTVSYIGNHGSQLLQSVYSYYVNNAESLNYTSNGANSSYNALQTQYQARLFHGLTAFGAYTWSHSIDDAALQQNGYFDLPIRGNSDADQRNVARLGVSYTAPQLRGRLLSEFLGEWGTDMNISIQSGLPFDLQVGYIDEPDAAEQIARPNVVPGIRPWMPNPSAPGGWQLNPDAFSVPDTDANGQYLPGTLGRNVFHGFAVGQADVDVRKTFRLAEPFNLQFRAEAFNLTNHPNFSNYDTYITDSTVGQAQSTLRAQLGGLSPLYQVGGPRSLQFALKLIF
jgi:hypothetical protein